MSDDERERAERYAGALNEAGHAGAKDWRVTAGAGESAVIVSDTNKAGLAMEWAERAVRAIAERQAVAVGPRWVLASVGDGWKSRWNFDGESEARAKYAERVERGDSAVALYRLDPTLVATTETEAGR